MIFIIGLGNPGKKLEKTRHNLGFFILDAFLKKNRKLYHFSKFELKKENHSLISEGKLNNKEIFLIKPQTFMNQSGQAIRSLIKPYLHKKSIVLKRDLWVVHDEIDLPLGKMKISVGRGSAGHKGVQSIIDELRTKNFVRFRIGIGPKNERAKDLGKFVLTKFNKSEEKMLKTVIKKAVEAIELAIREGVEKAMSQFNK